MLKYYPYMGMQEMKKLLGNMKEMEVELKNCHQENSELRAKTANLHEQLLLTRAALEQGVQEKACMVEETKVFNQNPHSLEMRIQDDHSWRRSLNEAQDTQLSEIVMHEIHKRRLFDEKYSLPSQMHSEENSQNWNESTGRLTPGNAAHSDDMLSAFSRLFCRIEQGADPATKKKVFSRTESTVSQVAKNLNSSLHLANRLGNEFLQVLHSIENYDIPCLEGHAASKGAVGKSLEALQVLLLESARVGLRLFSNVSSKESSLAPAKLQQPIQEVASFGVSIATVNTELVPESIEHKNHSCYLI